MPKKMPYLIRPPPTNSIDACNPLLTYTLAGPTPSELSKLKDLQNWGWEVAVHFHDDAEYLDALERTEKAMKKRRRRTQMVYGDMMGDGPRLAFEEVWEREMNTKLTQGLYKIGKREEGDSDQASIMSQMTQQRAWLRWADEEVELGEKTPNDIQAVNERSRLPPLSRLEDGKSAGEYVFQGPTGRPITRRRTNSTFRFIEEDGTNWHAIASSCSPQHACPQPADQETLQSSTPSTSTTSPEESNLVDPYMLDVATWGHWCPPPFLQAWSHQRPRSRPAAPRTKLSSRKAKQRRELRKGVARCNSEPSVSYWLPPRFVRPLSWVKRTRGESAGVDASLTAPDQRQTGGMGNAKRPPDSVSQYSTFQSRQLSPSTTASDNSSGTLQPTTSTDSDPSLDLHQITSTFLQPEPRGISPAPSTTSSLIYPGREITQEEYFRRTNRPQANLQPRQLTPHSGLEAETDPYEWQAWDCGHVCRESKADRLPGKDSMRRSSTGNTDRERNRYGWYNDFQRKMKKEQIRAQKEQREADKEKKKEKKKLERQEKKRKEDAAREALRKQGMFSGGYLPRYI